MGASQLVCIYNHQRDVTLGPSVRAFLERFSEEGRPALNVGSTILWAGVLDCRRNKQTNVGKEANPEPAITSVCYPIHPHEDKQPPATTVPSYREPPTNQLFLL